jgi:transcriptional regulator with XRE-family HTH domain
MAFNAYDASSREARLLRADAGDYIKKLRINAEMTQREFADKLNLEYYTFVSQLECGQGRLPPKLWVKAALALGQDPKVFALKMLSYYDPYAHQAITSGELPNG